MNLTTLLSALLCCAATALAGCNREPYWMDADSIDGELPDVVPNPADRTDPGGEMHDPPADDDARERSSAYCSPEEIAEVRRQNTTPYGVVTEEGAWCRKYTHDAKPPVKDAVPTEPSRAR